MRCQHMDDDIECMFDATRRLLVASSDPPDPDQAGFAVTISWSRSATSTTPTHASRCPCQALPVPCRSANVPGR
jgi:hypothetical protein